MNIQTMHTEFLYERTHLEDVYLYSSCIWWNGQNRKTTHRQLLANKGIETDKDHY